MALHACPCLRSRVPDLCVVNLTGCCAVARTVLGYKGSSLTQCALVLHRLHAPPSGAHLTGDQSKPYRMLDVLPKLIHVMPSLHCDRVEGCNLCCSQALQKNDMI